MMMTTIIPWEVYDANAKGDKEREMRFGRSIQLKGEDFKGNYNIIPYKVIKNKKLNLLVIITIGLYSL